MSTRRLFSVQEANALLPDLEAFLYRLTQKKEQMQRLHDELFMSELLQEAVQNQASQGHGDSGAHESSHLVFKKRSPARKGKISGPGFPGFGGEEVFTRKPLPRTHGPLS